MLFRSEPARAMQFVKVRVTVRVMALVKLLMVVLEHVKVRVSVGVKVFVKILKPNQLAMANHLLMVKSALVN